MPPIKILIADDHQIVLEGFNSLLEKEDDIEVVGCASNGREALQIAKKHEIDVAVLDIEMPVLNGIETTKKLKQLNSDIKILILSMYNNSEFIKKLIAFGASGYILKNKGHEELVTAIHKIHAGDEFFGEEVTKTLLSGFKTPSPSDMVYSVKLSKRETDVLQLIGKGFSSPQISQELNIAKSTIETHRRNLIEKLGASSTKDLIRYALKNGYA